MKVTDKTSHFSLIWGGGYRNKSLSKSLGAAVFLSFGSSGGPLGPLGLLDEQKRSRWRLRIQNSENVPFWVYPPVLTRMFIIWSIFGLVERIMKKTTSLGSESIPNVKNINFALESFFLDDLLGTALPNFLLWSKIFQLPPFLRIFEILERTKKGKGGS